MYYFFFPVVFFLFVVLIWLQVTFLQQLATDFSFQLNK